MRCEQQDIRVTTEGSVQAGRKDLRISGQREDAVCSRQSHVLETAELIRGDTVQAGARLFYRPNGLNIRAENICQYYEQGE